MIFRICQDDLSSQTGQNLNLLLKTYECEDPRTLIKHRQIIKSQRVNPLVEGEEWKINVLDELCLAKKGLIELDIEPDEIDMIMNVVATA